MDQPVVVTVLIFGSLLFLLALGLPIAFITGGVGIVFMTILWGPDAFLSLALNTLKKVSDFIFVAVPLFVFMGAILERSGIAEDLYSAFQGWLGFIRGGLAMANVIICAIMAAMMGIAGAEVTVMGIVALPSLLKYGYNKNLAMGSIMAGGDLAQLIPPSLLFIIYGAEASVSVGKLFMGGFPAGLILASLYISYIGIRAYTQKHLCPTVPREERPSLREKLVSTRAVILPIIIVLLVLGSIFTGVATPSEAAGVGVVAAAFAAAVKRRLNLQNLKEAMTTTLHVTGMIMWVVIGATAYASVFTATGGAYLIRDLLIGLELGSTGTLILLMVIVFFLAMFLDSVAIILLTMPLYLPIIHAMGWHPVWFGVLYVVNLQLGFITPPYGVSLFYLRAVAPPGITMKDIYLSTYPFVLITFVGMAIMIAFPQVITWLPDMAIR